MSDTIIDLPPESWWNRFWRNIKKIHPGVQAAIVAGIFSLAGIWLGYQLQSSGLNSTVNSLKSQVKKQAAIIRDKTAEIQRLETQLTPFKTFALEKYTGSEQERMQKLAERIQELEELASPRKLTQDQKKNLSDQLKSFKSEFQVMFTSRLLDQESANFAEQIAEIFRQSNWKVGPANKSFYTGNIKGDVAIVITDDSQKSDANKIIGFFDLVGIKVKKEQIRENTISGIQQNTIHIVIGSKIKSNN